MTRPGVTETGASGTLWRRYCLSVAFWPATTLLLLAVWIIPATVMTGPGAFVTGYALFTAGLVLALILKKRTRRRIAAEPATQAPRDPNPAHGKADPDDTK